MAEAPRCMVSCRCAVHPSEDPEKVAHAVSFIAGDAAVSLSHNEVVFRAAGLECLYRVRDAAASRRRLYTRYLESNQDGDATWFYLNKQAAWAGIVAICAEADESPLGPIKVSLQSSDIDGVIRWLVSGSIKIE